MGVIVVLGCVLVAFSRQERLHPPKAKSNTTPPTLTANWSVGLSFDICGKIEPSLPPSPATTTIGIKTPGDGIIKVQPLTAADTGHNATLGRFASHYPGLVLTSSEVRYPGGPLYKNGQSCEGKPGQLEVMNWSNPTATKGTLAAGNPDDLLLENGQLITVAFLPKDSSIPKPPGTVVTALFNAMNAAVESSASTTTTAPSTSVTVPVTTVTTSAGSKSTATTTAKPATTSTTAKSP